MHINTSMRKEEVESLAFLPSGGQRSHWDLKENQTSSVGDGVYQGKRSEREAGARTQKELQASLKVKIEDIAEVSRLLDPVSRIEISRKAIRDHFEERISAFLMQLIDCYGVPYHFTIGRTESQTKSTSSVQFVPGDGITFPRGSKVKMAYASAHHGTIPCLYAYERQKWENWKEHGDPQAPNKPTATVYLKNSDTYFANNACTGVEKVINEVDIDIDGNTTEHHVEFGRRKEEG